MTIALRDNFPNPTEPASLRLVTPVYLYVPEDRMPNEDEINQFKEVLEYYSDDQSSSNNWIHLSQKIRFWFNPIYTLRTRENARSLIKVLQAIGEADPDYLFEKIEKLKLEYIVVEPLLGFKDLRQDFYKMLGAIEFTDQQKITLIRGHIFQPGKWVFIPELECTVGWLNNLSQKDRGILLDTEVRVANRPFDNSNHPLAGKNFLPEGKNLTILDHLVLAGVVEPPADYPPKDWNLNGELRLRYFD